MRCSEEEVIIRETSFGVRQRVEARPDGIQEGKVEPLVANCTLKCFRGRGNNGNRKIGRVMDVG